MLVGQVWHLHLAMDSYAEDSKILSNGHVIEHNSVFRHGSHSLRRALCTNVCSARTFVCAHINVCVPVIRNMRAEALPRYEKCFELRQSLTSSSVALHAGHDEQILKAYLAGQQWSFSIVDQQQPPDVVCHHCWPCPDDYLDQNSDY